MAAKHKLQHSTITIGSALPPDRLLATAEEVADNLTQSKGRSKGRLFQYGWTVVERRPDELTIHIGSTRKTLLDFVVACSSTGSGSTMTTRIDGFRTTQSTYIGIPVGPKTLVAYPSYRTFMLDLARAVEAADPSCSIQIVERPGKNS